MCRYRCIIIPSWEKLKKKSLFETITGMNTYALSSSDVGIICQTGLFILNISFNINLHALHFVLNWGYIPLVKGETK